MKLPEKFQTTSLKGQVIGHYLKFNIIMNTMYRLCLLGALLLLLSACQKEENWQTLPQEIPTKSRRGGTYDTFGQKLEHVFSKAIKDPVFKYRVIEHTRGLPVGDFEVLLSDLLASGSPIAAETLEDMLLRYSAGVFSKVELTNFLRDYPSVIVGVRGGYHSWVKNNVVPPVAFVPTSFLESDFTINGHRNGQPHEIALNKAFSETVIAIRLSERHDLNGTILTADQGGVQVVTGGTNCDELPEDCPTEPILVTAFDVNIVNGAAAISYSLEIPDGVCPEWVRIQVVQGNPDGEIALPIRTGADFPVFYDSSVREGIQYDYTINVFVVSESGQCKGIYSDDIETVFIEEDAHPDYVAVTDFLAQNINSHAIEFIWEPPSGIAVDQYRIRYRTNDGGELIDLPGMPVSSNTLSHVWPYPEELRGQKLEAVIDYRSAGSWHATFTHDVLATFRDPGQDAYLSGIDYENIEDLEQNELGENPINGFPELRLVALQAEPGVAVNRSVVVEHTIHPLTRCYDYSLFPDFGDFGQHLQEQGTTDDLDELDRILSYASYYADTHLLSETWYSIYGSMKIKTNWDNNLSGRLIRVIGYETDVTTVNLEHLTETEINQNSKNLSVNLFKRDFLGLASGSLNLRYSYEEKTTESTRFVSPTTDSQIFDETLWYENYPTFVSENGQHYNLNEIDDLCSYFSGGD